MYFEYGEEEVNYLKSKDKRLSQVIDRLGHINRSVDTDLFASLVHNIIAQQISAKAEQSIWKKINEQLGAVNVDTITALEREELQQFGISFRKADYILEFASKVKTGEFDIQGIYEKSDEEVIAELISLRGVGVWTAEMILLFCMQRPNVFSYGDFGILKGIRMVYHHREITKERFERYRRRFSPYCSVASLYFWEVAGGAIDGMKDFGSR